MKSKWLLIFIVLKKILKEREEAPPQHDGALAAVANKFAIDALVCTINHLFGNNKTGTQIPKIIATVYGLEKQYNQISTEANTTSTSEHLLHLLLSTTKDTSTWIGFSFR